MRRLLLLILAGVAATVAAGTAQTARVDGFTATVVNVADAVSPTFRVDLTRWSTDAERDRVTAAFATKGDAALADVLKDVPTVGYIWTGESVGYPVRFAYRQMLPDGSERIVLASDRRLGSYQPKPWAAVPPAQAQNYTFTVIELHLPKGGPGEGKISINTRITSESTAKTLTLENYAFAPVVLRNIRRP